MLRGPGPAEALNLTEVPVPDVAVGTVLIRVHAFGLNRSEMHLRQGVAGNATFPRIPGIEAAGVVASAPGGELAEGTQVVTMMGGMSHEFDGGYAHSPATRSWSAEERPQSGWHSSCSPKRMDLTALATTRRDTNTTMLANLGADHVLIDDGHLAAKILMGCCGSTSPTSR